MAQPQAEKDQGQDGCGDRIDDPHIEDRPRTMTLLTEGENKMVTFKVGLWLSRSDNLQRREMSLFFQGWDRAIDAVGQGIC